MTEDIGVFFMFHLVRPERDVLSKCTHSLANIRQLFNHSHCVCTIKVSYSEPVIWAEIFILAQYLIFKPLSDDTDDVLILSAMMGLCQCCMCTVGLHCVVLNVWLSLLWRTSWVRCFVHWVRSSARLAAGWKGHSRKYRTHTQQWADGHQRSRNSRDFNVQ